MFRKPDSKSNAHKKALKDAESALFRARLDQKLGPEIRAAREAVKPLAKPLAELQSYNVFLSNDCKVFFDAVKVKGDEHPLTADITSRIDGSGRSLVVVVEAAEWYATIQPHPDDVAKAHGFVLALNRQVAKVAAGEELVPAEFRAARSSLAELESRLEADVATAEAEAERLKATT